MTSRGLIEHRQLGAEVHVLHHLQRHQVVPSEARHTKQLMRQTTLYLKAPSPSDASSSALLARNFSRPGFHMSSDNYISTSGLSKTSELSWIFWRPVSAHLVSNLTPLLW